MSKQRDHFDYMRDMWQYATDAEDFVAGMSYEQFAASRQTQHAVLYAITIVGEAIAPNTGRSPKSVMLWMRVCAARCWRSFLP